MVDQTRLLLFAVVIWAVPLSLFAAAVGEEDTSGEECSTEKLSSEDHLPKDHGVAKSTAMGAVRHGCIASHLIRRVSFDDDRTGTLELANRQRVRLTLKNACSGIRFNGYVHRPVNRRFCEGDTLRVMGSGGFCVVDSLEPLAHDDADADAAEHSAGDSVEKR